MKRRKLARADSLDLLLSTMTSSFAGIILIAILMALTSRDANQATDKARIAEANNGILQRKIDKTKADIAAASDLKNNLQAALTQTQFDAILALMDEKDRLKARLDDALSANASLAAIAKSSHAGRQGSNGNPSRPQKRNRRPQKPKGPGNRPPSRPHGPDSGFECPAFRHGGSNGQGLQ